MRVTEKGQVTIPKAIRDRLGIRPGSEVEFVEGPDGVNLVRESGKDKSVRKAQVRAWLKKVSGSGISGLSSDEYMAHMRDGEIPSPHKQG